MADWTSIDGGDAEPEPGKLAELDQYGAAVKDGMSSIISAQVAFLLAMHRGDEDAMRDAGMRAGSVAVSLDQQTAVSIILTLCVGEAQDYIESCGGPEAVQKRVDADECPCGEDDCGEERRLFGQPHDS